MLALRLESMRAGRGLASRTPAGSAEGHPPPPDMTLRHLKLIAILAPIVLVTGLEVVRYAMVGLLDWKTRLVLDTTALVFVFSLFGFIFRFVGRLHSRLERQNRELLALHGAGIDIAVEHLWRSAGDFKERAFVVSVGIGVRP